mgnify:CR=1 FL=1|tara:strand:+ start:1358 stop:3199 length:1842 start_codon:yes stop_codon:yes gene_type:complete
MALDPKKVFVAPSLPKSSRTQAQRDATAGKSGDGISSKQFLSLNKNIIAINKNLNAIANLIKEKAQQDAESDRDDADRRRRDADAKKKGAAEKMLEGVISNAVIKPLKTVKALTGSIFEKLFKALGALFAGWVGMKGVDGIKDWLKGDRSTLQNLAKEVGLVIAAATGVFAAVTIGLPLLTSGIGGVIGAVVGGLPGVFALLGNPYVWMGVIAATGLVYSGTELYKYLSAEYGSMGGGFSGRGSFSKDDQIWIDRIYEVGQEGAVKEMDAKILKIAEKYPHLFDWKDGVPTPKGHTARFLAGKSDGRTAAANNALQDMLDAKKYIGFGKYDKFDVAKLSKSDQQSLQAIMQHTTKAKSAWELFKLKQNELSVLMEGKTYYELSEGVQKIVDGILEEQALCKDQIVGALKAGNELENKMSSNGQDFLNGIAQANDMGRLWSRNDGWADHIVLGPIRNKGHDTDIVNPGMKPAAIKHFDKIIGIDKAYTHVIPPGLERAGFKPEVSSSNASQKFLSAQNNTKDGITNGDIFETSKFYTDKNLSTAELFNGSSFLNDQNFEFVPIDMSSTFSGDGTGLLTDGAEYDPAVLEAFTANHANDDYISLFESQIGVYSDK